jgi:hypothetical protein
MSLAETTAAAPATHVSVEPSTDRQVSLQMRSVITIFAADNGLFDVLSPFIDFANNSIDWPRIRSLSLCSGHKAVVDWAWICWCGEIPEGTNPFDAVPDLDDQFRRAIVKALAVRWGVSK